MGLAMMELLMGPLEVTRAVNNSPYCVTIVGINLGVTKCPESWVLSLQGSANQLQSAKELPM